MGASSSQEASSLDASLTKAAKIAAKGNTVNPSSSDLQELSRVLMTMPDKNCKDNTKAMLARLFEVANSKM